MNTVHRFFVPHDCIAEDSVIIYGSDVNHIKNVLRSKPGQGIEVFDSAGNTYHVIINEIDKQKIICTIKSKIKADTESSLEITLAQCLPKGKKMDFIIQKATELGAKAIIPVLSERTVPKIEEKADKKLSHWQKIAQEAAEQSGRVGIPEIMPPTTFQDLLKQSNKYDLSLLPWEGEKEKPLKKVLVNNDKTKKILVLIGPEGGFSRNEVTLAEKAGFAIIHLGKRILRTETAGLVILSQILYALE